MFQLDDADASGVRRIAALVGRAGAATKREILQALRGSIDPVFLPRPLRRVDALPRNDTGKLPRAALLHCCRAACAERVGAHASCRRDPPSFADAAITRPVQTRAAPTQGSILVPSAESKESAAWASSSG